MKLMIKQPNKFPLGNKMGAGLKALQSMCLVYFLEREARTLFIGDSLCDSPSSLLFKEGEGGEKDRMSSPIRRLDNAARISNGKWRSISPLKHLLLWMGGGIFQDFFGDCCCFGKYNCDCQSNQNLWISEWHR